MSRAFCPDFSDSLHKVACHLGSWQRLRPNHIPSQLYVSIFNVHYNCKIAMHFFLSCSWYNDNLFPPGSIVKHQRELYKAEGVLCVASEPGNPVHQRFQVPNYRDTFFMLWFWCSLVNDLNFYFISDSLLRKLFSTPSYCISYVVDTDWFPCFDADGRVVSTDFHWNHHHHFLLYVHKTG